MPAVVLQYYTAVGHGGARGRVRASAPCPRDTHWPVAVAQAHPHDLPTWVLGSTAASPVATTMHGTDGYGGLVCSL